MYGLLGLTGDDNLMCDGVFDDAGCFRREPCLLLGMDGAGLGDVDLMPTPAERIGDEPDDRHDADQQQRGDDGDGDGFGGHFVCLSSDLR